MITASELLASAHEADRQLKKLGESAEALRLLEEEFRVLQRKLTRFTEAARAVLDNKPLRAQLGSAHSHSLELAMVCVRETATYIDRVYADERLDGFI